MSSTTDATAEPTTVTLRSRALVGGSIDVVDKRPSGKRRLTSASRFKDRAVPLLVWFLRKAPRPLALLPVNALLSIAGLLYRLNRNPLRRAAQDMSAICRANGHDIPARAIYRAFLDNARALTRLVLRLYRDGWQAVIEDVQFDAADVDRIQQLVDAHGGVAVAVPHNLGSTFSGIRFDKAFASVLLSKNPASVERTRIALDFFERLDAKVLMVRDGSPMQISRSLIKLLRSGKVVAVTMDRLVDSSEGIEATVFGETAWFPAWATRIPTAIDAPIVPAYVHSRGPQIHVTFGQAIVTKDPGEATARVAEFLQQQVLADPASWAFMVEKRWGRILGAAASRLA